jgi:outer membrane protein assembly factor BamB
MQLSICILTHCQPELLPKCVAACKTFAMCGEWSSPAAINNLLFFGLSDYGLHAATTDGKLVWGFGTQGPVVSSPAISHSSVYFGSFDGFVYCLSF